MVTSEAQKAATAAQRKRRRDAGMKPITVWLLPSEQEALKGYTERSGHSQNMAVQSAVLELHHWCRPADYVREPFG